LTYLLIIIMFKYINIIFYIIYYKIYNYIKKHWGLGIGDWGVGGGGGGANPPPPHPPPHPPNPHNLFFFLKKIFNILKNIFL